MSRGIPIGGNGAGGEGGVHATIAQDDDGTKGVEVAINEDATWKLEGVQRTTGSRATLEIPGETAGSMVAITAPSALTRNNAAQYARANNWALVLAHGLDPVPEVLAVPAVAAVAAVNASVDVRWNSIGNL